MQIKLTPKELSCLKEIASSIDEEVIEEIEECIQDNRLIKTNITPTGITIKINSDYTEDFLSVYGKFIKLIVPQMKTMYETFTLFQEEVEEVIENHTAKEKTEESGEDNG